MALGSQAGDAANSEQVRSASSRQQNVPMGSPNWASSGDWDAEFQVARKTALRPQGVPSTCNERGYLTSSGEWEAAFREARKKVFGKHQGANARSEQSKFASSGE